MELLDNISSIGRNFRCFLSWAASLKWKSLKIIFWSKIFWLTSICWVYKEISCSPFHICNILRSFYPTSQQRYIHSFCSSMETCLAWRRFYKHFKIRKRGNRFITWGRAPAFLRWLHDQEEESHEFHKWLAADNPCRPSQSWTKDSPHIHTGKLSHRHARGWVLFPGPVMIVSFFQK